MYETQWMAEEVLAMTCMVMGVVSTLPIRWRKQQTAQSAKEQQQQQQRTLKPLEIMGNSMLAHNVSSSNASDIPSPHPSTCTSSTDSGSNAFLFEDSFTSGGSSGRRRRRRGGKKNDTTTTYSSMTMTDPVAQQYTMEHQEEDTTTFFIPVTINNNTDNNVGCGLFLQWDASSRWRCPTTPVHTLKHHIISQLESSIPPTCTVTTIEFLTSSGRRITLGDDKECVPVTDLIPKDEDHIVAVNVIVIGQAQPKQMVDDESCLCPILCGGGRESTTDKKEGVDVNASFASNASSCLTNSSLAKRRWRHDPYSFNECQIFE